MAHNMRGCQCDQCQHRRDYMREYMRRRNESVAVVDREALIDLLHELFPRGLTDDCPARRTVTAS